MAVTVSKFGELDGENVNAYTMRNKHGIEVTCIDYGCTITKLLTPDANGKLENIVLGFDDLESYLQHSQYFGAVIGRVAGRIKDGQFDLDGKVYRLAQNEDDKHIHGGERGFDKVIWQADIEETEEEATVVFTYHSPDGEEGYPGNLEMTVKYILTDDNAFVIEYHGVSDQRTLLNVTNHSYFNLSGNIKTDILDHELTLGSRHYLELTDKFLPTGEKLEVSGTPFDFRQGRKIRDGVTSTLEQNKLVGNGYDHPFLLDEADKQIVLSDPTSGRKMTMETTEPCVVLYTGNKISDELIIRDVQGKKYVGLCLETQGVPDAVHHPQFPSVVLEKGDVYRSRTVYTFN
ncbi:aldose 1-epimerase [Evansella caseinilytica]|uniref:Aldose 1-epimerase n=1 Tax=Evansella caseinilytica TaxID=1503961 RepID=A0A1H3TFA8_9BACI|nr:aldose epimerase family protein [Evansella caseinilytica]SDZ48521.1 aldose 1-epimerase [Evansella caseinilytica]